MKIDVIEDVIRFEGMCNLNTIYYSVKFVVALFDYVFDKMDLQVIMNI